MLIPLSSHEITIRYEWNTNSVSKKPNSKCTVADMKWQIICLISIKNIEAASDKMTSKDHCALVIKSKDLRIV